ncbi:L-lactate dehydrogenase complex protein LldG [Desulfacinum hydrothermale DSM 13146]|uniref:L-lactate dehydrogenase complex protein LldG n=1 Tax=Desulfacinum hydrothermale DSM 13146 TaxID=1121390 RepID=A0A1W1XXW2_9BACT|nr:lactate utilization protein [Desulfacinum hydrothermale]SMC28348.1 L-lactate dehydrogenase complex protein LldG [Desulfacinum hydrothermale DSM 13146]
MNRTELLQHFEERAQAVQTVVHRVADWAEAVRYALELTAHRAGATLAPVGVPKEALSALVEQGASHQVRLLEPPLRNHLEDIHTGLTPADWAIAETGTLVLDSTSEDLRIATMLSEVHVAVLPASRIREESLELGHEMAALQKDGPRYLAFISGASRTADIERVLTIGVHGPQELHVLILEEDAS